MKIPDKLTPCCANPKCKTHQAAVELLSFWGLSTELLKDRKGFYFDLTIPEYWGERRRNAFAAAVQLVPTSHDDPPKRYKRRPA